MAGLLFGTFQGANYYSKRATLRARNTCQGYVAAGRIDLAQIELNEIKNRAGINSEEYKDLSKAIDTGVIEAD